jgi:hypothetical protein
MKIRPHHVLCAHFFVGKGYSDQFVAQMKQTLEELRREGSSVTLTDGCDELCTACPNNQRGVCRTEEKVRSIDRRAAEAMQLTIGNTERWRELCSLAEQRILRPGRLREICGDCEWIGLCESMEQ